MTLGIAGLLYEVGWENAEAVFETGKRPGIRKIATKRIRNLGIDENARHACICVQ
jgi:hypothetical protein